MSLSQSYENHRRLNWLSIGMVLAALAGTVLAGVNVAAESAAISLWLMVLFGALLTLCPIDGRQNDLTLQNRLVRLEMQIRLRDVLPEDLRSRAEALTLDQLIALRFAPDAELPDLVRRTLDGELDSPDAIKRAVQDWRPDTLRV